MSTALPHTDTVPVWGAAEAPSWRDYPVEATPWERVQASPPAKVPGSILPRLFVPYSVTFLFYFTLIMIIQEYYLR